MASEPVRLDLQEDAVKEVMNLAKAADKLPHVISTATSTRPKIGVKAFNQHLAGLVGMPTFELRPLLNAILNLYHTQVKLKTDSKSVVEAITQFFEREPISPEGQKALAAWRAGKSNILIAAEMLHADHPLISSFKAFQVAAKRQLDLVEMRIFTEARPVFNEAGDKVIQTVITHTLSLDYHEGENHRLIQFNLDAGDVRELKEICERAERKASIIKHDLLQTGWLTTVFREPTDHTDKTK